MWNLPLKCDESYTLVLDTTDMSIEEALEAVKEIARVKLRSLSDNSASLLNIIGNLIVE